MAARKATAHQPNDSSKTEGFAAKRASRVHLTATLFVTKIEAARHQINAAIRMYFLQIDDLAITTVIGAARNT